MVIDESLLTCHVKLISDNRDSFLQGKVAGAWSWPLII